MGATISSGDLLLLWMSERASQPASCGLAMMTGINSFSATTNRLTSASYDSAGNITFNPVGIQQSYDAKNRLISYVDPLAVANNRTYGYYGDGRRVLKTITSPVARRGAESGSRTTTASRFLAVPGGAVG